MRVTTEVKSNIKENRTSKLLVDDYPLIILPKLANLIGLPEAIFLQQLHYWLNKYSEVPYHQREGRVWAWNTYKEWTEQFPFWNVSTIRRLVKKLIRKGYIIVGNYNRVKYDQTLWYTIDYLRLNDALRQTLSTGDPPTDASIMIPPSVHTGHMDMTNMSVPIPEITNDTTSENIVSRSEERGLKRYPETEYLLRPNNETFVSFCQDINNWINKNNDERPDKPFIWLPKNVSFEGDLKLLVYGKLPQCRTKKATDERKRNILYDLYNEQGGRLNWLNFVMVCIKYTVLTTRTKEITDLFAFTHSLLLKPATIVSALSDGILVNEKLKIDE